VLRPELDVVNAGVLECLADLLGADMVFYDYEIDFFLAHAVLPSVSNPLAW
jgi:hypothetical protein